MGDFEFKDLIVWRESVQLFNMIIDIIEDDFKYKGFKLRDQIIGAVSSISQNIAEGKGRQTDKEFVRFLIIARGSLYEVETLMYLFNERHWISSEKYTVINKKTNYVAILINKLIKSLM